MSELFFFADLKSGVALFPGSREDVQEHIESVARRCKRMNAMDVFMERVRMVCLGEDVDVSEAAYMLSTARLPRRVGIRLRRTKCEPPSLLEPA